MPYNGKGKNRTNIGFSIFGAPKSHFSFSCAHENHSNEERERKWKKSSRSSLHTVKPIELWNIKSKVFLLYYDQNGRVEIEGKMNRKSETI